MDLRELQTVLGHVRPETTARYAHLTEVTSAQARERQGHGAINSTTRQWRTKGGKFLFPHKDESWLALLARLILLGGME